MSKETVDLWILKADHDLKTGKDELMTESPATDMVCFHMQQCVEKYLKAFLVYSQREITRTHNIALLIQNCMDINIEFKQLSELGADVLSVYAVEARYPDDFYMPEQEEARSAVKMAEKVKEFVLSKIKG